MDSLTVNKINNINKHFYTTIAADFDITRERPWKGWSNITEIIEKELSDKISILDLGCGNCRYYNFIKGSLHTPFNYYGVDNNIELLNISHLKYPELNIGIVDILDMHLNDKFNVITAFGLTHHIPSKQLRIKFFNNISSLMAKPALLVLSFWLFNTKKAIKDDIGIFLEDNDYFLGWKGTPGLYRYCHYFNEEELNEIISLYEKGGVRLISRFKDDISKTDSNEYLVFKID